MGVDHLPWGRVSDGSDLVASGLPLALSLGWEARPQAVLAWGLPFSSQPVFRGPQPSLAPSLARFSVLYLLH